MSSFYCVIEFTHAATGARTISVVYGFNDALLNKFIANCKEPVQWLIVWEDDNG